MWHENRLVTGIRRLIANHLLEWIDHGIRVGVVADRLGKYGWQTRVLIIIADQELRVFAVEETQCGPDIVGPDKRSFLLVVGWSTCRGILGNRVDILSRIFPVPLDFGRRVASKCRDMADQAVDVVGVGEVIRSIFIVVADMTLRATALRFISWW